MSKIKVAHFCTFSPHACGLYHTAKDLILAERVLGIDAHMVNILVKKDEPRKNSIEYGRIGTDGWLTTVDQSWAREADILVLHSAIPDDFLSMSKPVIVVCHGRPESSFMLEHHEVLGTWSSYYTRARNPRYTAFVTFWPEFMSILKKYLPENRLFYVPAPVDLADYSMHGEVFSHGKFNGKPNIVVADMWRWDVTPFNVIMAADLFREKYAPEAKLHIIGLPSTKKKDITVLLYGLRESGILGNVTGNIRKVKEVIRSANMVITPHVIATRVIRESLALGTPVVAGVGCNYTPYQANPRDLEGFAHMMNQCWLNYQQDIHIREKCRSLAEQSFHPYASGKAMLKVFNSVLHPKKRKIFIDLGGHIGESIYRFYKEVPNAAEYEIYTFEPDPKNMEMLKKNTRRYKNITYIQKAAWGKTTRTEFYLGGINHQEGGTLVKGKKTGKVDYERPILVDTINFCDWLDRNFTANDYIVIKINIEGGEYGLFEVFEKTKILRKVNQVYVQLHSHKLSNPKYKVIEEYFLHHPNTKVYAKYKGFYPFEGLE